MTNVDSIVPPTPHAAPPPGAGAEPAPFGGLPLLDAPGPPDPGGPPPGDAGRRRRWYAFVGVVATIAVVITVLAFWRIPYYRFSPGGLYPTEQLISVDGAPSYADTGEIEFTTVAMKPATVLDAILGWQDPAVELVDKDKIDGGKQPEQNRQENLEMMATSKEVAEFVALRTLGYPVEVVGSGALVRNIAEGTPAAGILQPNDAIVSVGDRPVKLAQDAIDLLAESKPGDTVTLGVEARPGERRDVQVTLAARPDDAAKPYLGVGLGTRDQRFEAPFTVAIDSRDVGGPSAGLAFTLGVIDELTPGSLTGGKKVATTGTMDPAGNVGPVGGVTQKANAARRDGVELFLVPPDEYAEAQAAAGSMKVVPVDTIDAALAALAANGGDTQAVSQMAAANGVPAATR